MLKARAYEILKYLLERDGPILIKQLAEHLGVSERTVRYDLDQIEEWLMESGLTLERKRGVGIFLSDSTKEKLRDQIEFKESFQRVFSPEERQQIILRELLSREEPVIVKEFKILLNVFLAP